MRRSSGRVTLAMIEMPAPPQPYSTAPRRSDGGGRARLEYIVRVESPYPYRRAAEGKGEGEEGGGSGKGASPASSSADRLTYRLLAEDEIGKINSGDCRAETGMCPSCGEVWLLSCCGVSSLGECVPYFGCADGTCEDDAKAKAKAKAAPPVLPRTRKRDRLKRVSWFRVSCLLFRHVLAPDLEQHVACGKASVFQESDAGVRAWGASQMWRRITSDTRYVDDLV